MAVHNGAGGLIDNPTALGRTLQTCPGEVDIEPAEVPYIKDTKGLVSSMQMSLPSWNAGGPSTATSANAFLSSYPQGIAVTSAMSSSSAQYQGQPRAMAAQTACMSWQTLKDIVAS